MSTTTVQFSVIASRSYDDGYSSDENLGYFYHDEWDSDTIIRQGSYTVYGGTYDTVRYGPYYGTLHFGSGAGTPTALSGLTISSARIRFTRYSSSGSSPQSIRLNKCDLTSIPAAGAHSPDGSYVSGSGYTLGSISFSETKWFTLPVTYAEWVIAGKSLVIAYGSSWYQRLYGIEGSSAQEPIIEITYVNPNTVPNPPSSISITDTGFGEGTNIGAVTSVDISCGAASDTEDAETSLLYQFEYSVAGGAFQVLQSWVYDKTVTHNLSSITADQLIQYRVAAKDTGSAVSTYVYTTNYAYKIPAPSAPPSIGTPATITGFSTALDWADSPSYDTSVGVHYVAEIYNAKTAAWVVISSILDASTVTINAYDQLVTTSGTDGDRYYYSTTARIRAKAVFAQAVQGQTLASAYVTSNTFTIDYRVAPAITSFSVDWTGAAKGYESVAYTVSITKGVVTGNILDDDGNAMQYYYKVDLLYGAGYASVRNLAQTSNFVWASLPATVAITIPSNVLTTIDAAAKVRVSIYNVEGMSSYPADSSFTMKRYRNPTVNIISFVRNETDFSITFDITDTGLNDQTTAYITSAIATFGAVPLSYIFASVLTGLTIQFDADDGITASSNGIVTLVVTNAPDDSMAAKTGTDTQAIPQAIPNLRVANTGVYMKTAAFVRDANGNTYEVWHSGISTGIDTTVVTGTKGTAGNPTAYNSDGDLVEYSGDGWFACNETWTYVSATSFTVTGNKTSKYKKGDKYMWTQNGTVRYSNVYSASYSAGTGLTTITTHGGYVAAANDCDVLNTATYPITANYYSKFENPQNFPDAFHWAATYTGFSVDPTDGVFTFFVRGGWCYCEIRNGYNGTSDSANFTISAPITAAATNALLNDYYGDYALITDNGTRGAGEIEIQANTASFILGKGYTPAGFTTSGNKRCNFANIKYRY